MSAVVLPYKEDIALAAVGFLEGRRMLLDAADAEGEEASSLKASGNQLIASAFGFLQTAARRFVRTNEYLYPGAPKIITGDAEFRTALNKCADTIEQAAAHISAAGREVPKLLRAWPGAPATALRLIVQCDTAVRLSKTRAGRAHAR